MTDVTLIDDGTVESDKAARKILEQLAGRVLRTLPSPWKSIEGKTQQSVARIDQVSEDDYG